MVYTFNRLGTTWTETDKLTSPNWKGAAVALDGDAALVSTSEDAGGAVYVFQSPCTLTLDLTYTNNTLGIHYDVRTSQIARWAAQLYHAGSARPLWSTPLPPSTTPKTGDFNLPNFPASGPVGILSTIVTTAGRQCMTFDAINTGGGSLTQEELRSLSTQAGLPLP